MPLSDKHTTPRIIVHAYVHNKPHLAVSKGSKGPEYLSSRSRVSMCFCSRIISIHISIVLIIFSTTGTDMLLLLGM